MFRALLVKNGVSHRGTAGLYCYEVLLDVKMSYSCEETVGYCLTFSMLFHDVVWQ